ncbi:MAG: oligosaccharide flippase family protein [Clostridia bacterium]|nr:oligosaccharide flippase family protein [Clostridia bacterium]
MNKASKNSIIYGFGMIALAAAGLLNTVVLTHVLDGRTYAMYGLLITAANAAVTVISLGYPNSYMRFYYDHPQRKMNFLLRCIAIPLVLLILLVCCLLEPQRFLTSMLFETQLSLPAVLLLSCYLLFLLVHQFSVRGVRMEERAWNYVISECVFKFGFIFAVATLFWVHQTVSFLQVITCLAVCTFAAVAVNFFTLFRLKTKQEKTQDAPMSQAKLFGFGFPLMLHTAAVLVIPLIEKMLIRRLSGWETLGIYTAASVFFTFVNLFANAVNNVWEPIVYQNYRERKKFPAMLHDVAFSATAVSTLVFALSVLLRRWLVLPLAPQYHAVVSIVPTVIYAACFQMTSGFYSAGINIAQKTVHSTVSSVIQIVSSAALCFVLIPRFGLCGVAASVLISILLSRGYRAVVGVHYYSTGVREIKSLLLCVLCLPICFVTMIDYSFLSDVLLFVAVLVMLVLIGNRELLFLLKKGIRFFFGKSKESSQ